MPVLMTEQEYQTIVAIGDALRAQPMSWDQIPEETKATVIDIMRPKPSFSARANMAQQVINVGTTANVY